MFSPSVGGILLGSRFSCSEFWVWGLVGKPVIRV